MNLKEFKSWSKTEMIDGIESPEVMTASVSPVSWHDFGNGLGYLPSLIPAPL